MEEVYREGGVAQKQSLCAEAHEAPPSLCSPPTDEPVWREGASDIDKHREREREGAAGGDRELQ